MDRLCFVPFDAAHQGEFKTSSEQWDQVGPLLEEKKSFKVITYTGQRYIELINITRDATVYIRGHGNQGKGELSTNTNPPAGTPATRAQTLSIEDVCQRLMDSGLPKAFAGKIKFSSCWSGVAGDATPAAAQVGAKSFRKKGYKDCHIFGYMGPFGHDIDLPAPTAPADSWTMDASMTDGFRHKNVMVPAPGGGKATVKRASLARTEFEQPRKSWVNRAVEFLTPGS